MAEAADLERPLEQDAADIVTLTIGGHGSFLLGSGPLCRGFAVPIMRFSRRKDKPPVARANPGGQTISRSRKIRCTTRIKVPMMTICRDDAAAIVGSPCHWICENKWTGRLVDSGPDRNRARLMSENEMIKAKIAPDRRLDRSKGRLTRKNAWTRVAPKLIAASSRRGSMPISPAVTLRITYGVQMTRWPHSRVQIEACTASRA